MGEAAPVAPRRVAFVTGQLELGGAERQLVLMATQLRRAGNEIRVICLSRRTEPYRAELERHGVPVVVLERRGSWDPTRVLALRRVFTDFRADTVCSVAEFPTVYSHFASLGLRPRPRHVAMLRRSALRLSGVKRLLVRRAFARADAVCANSEAGRRYGAADLGVPDSRIRILRNAVPERLWSLEVDRAAVRAAVGVRPDERVVVYVGRDAPPKDLPTLARTLGRLSQARGAPRVWCIGPGLERPLEGAPGPDRGVDWLGPRPDALELIAAADVLLLTSSSEGTPNVVLEAMALGRAVVSTAVGDVPALLASGPAGLTAPAGDDGALAAALRELLDDAARRERMGAAGRATILRDFTTDAMLRGLRQLLGCDPATSA